MLLADFFYNGVARWQLGFDNPNKAAVLAVELILVGLAFVVATRRLVLRVLGAVLTVSSLYVLLHTFSRGGMVALAVAAVPLAIGILRHLKGTRTCVRVCFLVIAVAFCLLSVRMGDVGRLVHGFSGEDRSVGNRIELWRSVPRMLRDAPFGWGIGKSGEVYRQWYQPLDRDERYRTLVNSHLTWIVETGIVGGVVWSLGWGIVLAFVLNARQVPADAEVVVICGGADDAGRRGRQKTIWLSPKRTDIQPGEDQMVVVGALSSEAEVYGSGKGVVRIEGAGDYIPNWPNLLMDLFILKPWKFPPHGRNMVN